VSGRDKGETIGMPPASRQAVSGAGAAIAGRVAITRLIGEFSDRGFAGLAPRCPASGLAAGVEMSVKDSQRG
jgi:hypothetical protein